MMKPLAPYACRGIVWYQGEANAYTFADMQQYGVTLPLWIERYRKEWGQDKFHFLGVMLPGYGRLSQEAVDLEDPATISWSYMRESQLSALALPDTYIANTIDLGQKLDIHPKDKLPIGQRLALLALRNTLDLKIQAEGPVMQRVERKESALVVHYGPAVRLKTNDGAAPKAFWLADEAKKWVPAQAEIRGGNRRLDGRRYETPAVRAIRFFGNAPGELGQ